MLFIKRNRSNSNIAKLNRLLKATDWSFIYEHSAQGAFSMFQGVIDLHFGNSCPKQTFTMNYSNRLPWMSDALRRSIKLKNRMHIESKCEPNNFQKKHDYKARNKVIQT